MALDKKNKKLTALDLFSGIGGLALSLLPIFETLLYCENNITAINVLTNNMKKGFIDSAPIHNNVITLNQEIIKETTNNKPIDLVVGGFPCVGFSSAGLLQGFNNEASFLFFEIKRIIGEIKPTFIFLENVPGVKKSLNVIVNSLDKLGYTMVWITVSAEIAAGIPMLRKRWFLFGYRSDIAFNDINFISKLKNLMLPTPFFVKKATSNDFPSLYIELYPRTVSPEICSFKQSKEQISLIGNSVCVPQVQMVWNELICRAIANFENLELGSVTEVTELANGYWDKNNKFVKMDIFSPNIIRPSCKLVLDSNVCPLPLKRSPNQKLPNLSKPFIQKRFMTPVYTKKGADCVLTKRTAHDHPTQIKFEVNTQNRFYPLNPLFYEALFGFPPTFSQVYKSSRI